MLGSEHPSILPNQNITLHFFPFSPSHSLSSSPPPSPPSLTICATNKSGLSFFTLSISRCIAHLMCVVRWDNSRSAGRDGEEELERKRGREGERERERKSGLLSHFMEFSTCTEMGNSLSSSTKYDTAAEDVSHERKKVRCRTLRRESQNGSVSAFHMPDDRHVGCITVGMRYWKRREFERKRSQASVCLRVRVCVCVCVCVCLPNERREGISIPNTSKNIPFQLKRVKKSILRQGRENVIYIERKRGRDSQGSRCV